MCFDSLADDQEEERPQLRPRLPKTVLPEQESEGKLEESPAALPKKRVGRPSHKKTQQQEASLQYSSHETLQSLLNPQTVLCVVS